jgi:hypothetical protein
MLFLLDANILIYGANPVSPLFAECKRATNAIAQKGDTPCIVPQSLYEFWTVATRQPNPQSALSGLGMTPAQAYAEVITIKKLFLVPGQFANSSGMGTPRHSPRCVRKEWPRYALCSRDECSRHHSFTDNQ